MAPTPKKTPVSVKKTPAAKRTPAGHKTPVVRPTVEKELRRSARKIQRSCSKTTLKSSDEEQADHAKKFAFKASPLNRKILAPGCMTGIPLVTREKKVTVVKPFSFATEDRLAVRKKVTEVRKENKTGGARIAKPVARPPLKTANKKVKQ